MPFHAHSQKRCTTDEYREYLQERSRQVSSKIFEKRLRELRSRATLRTLRTTADTVLIPVVVHVIHNGELLGNGVNIPENQILSQIEVLNEDFQRKNPDTVQTPIEFAAIAGKINIQFVLARQDPNGLPTNGIVRKQGSKTSWNPLNQDNELLKSESYWPAEDYLNIWVCNLSGENLGYAQFPDLDMPGLENEMKENRLTDGVVIDYTVFGSSNKGNFDNLRVPYDKGRTTSHEIGHWLGLLHIFADPGSCIASDYVDDTPSQQSSYNGECPDHPVSSCESDDMFQNYMDYTADACMNIFTMGQSDRMQVVLDNAPRRTSLLNAAGAFPPDFDYSDIGIVQVNSPTLISCDETIQPIVTIQNFGTNPIGRIIARYGVEDDLILTDTLDIDSLFAGQQLVLSLQEFNLIQGQYNFLFEFDVPNDDDLYPENNQSSLPFIIHNERVQPPYVEMFEDFDLWATFSSDEFKTWEIASINDETSAFINLYNYPDEGEQDWLFTPLIDLSNTFSATMQFDISYVQNGDFMDSLTILASEDCGVSFQEIFTQSGEEFKVKDERDFWEPEDDEDWKNITLDLSDFTGSSDVRLAFVTTNGYGNNLYIDNVEFFLQSEEKIVEVEENNILIYPNPTEGSRFNFNINTETKQDVEISIYSSLGQKIYSKLLAGTLNQYFSVDLMGNPAGVYLVKVKGETIDTIQKLILRP